VKHLAAVFAIGDGIEASRFLEGDGGSDMFVLDGAKRRGIDLAPDALVSRRRQRGGTQEATHVIGAKGRVSVCSHAMFSPHGLAVSPF